MGPLYESPTRKWVLTESPATGASRLRARRGPPFESLAGTVQLGARSGLSFERSAEIRQLRARSVHVD